MNPKKNHYILALDLGTTGNRAILFNQAGTAVSSAYKELTQYYPQPGWLEHDPREIWEDTCWAIQTALQKANIIAENVAAIGLSVQRETCLLWDKTTGRPLYNAIVWQDRRTADLCNDLKNQGYASEIHQRTGLILDAYFSATKLSWLLQEIQKQIPKVDPKNILAGTIDTWILWNLTGRQVHATDDSNASRTMLMNLASRQWDSTLLDLFKIPSNLMPKILPSLGYFGSTQAELFGKSIPITGILGDQQASLFAHGCNHPGLLKCTYGTGCFLISHTGETLQHSRNNLLSTVAWTQTEKNGSIKAGYALEGSMFTTGACIQWLRDGIKIITAATETESMAQRISDSGGVYFVPALSGLGAPHWDMSTRGSFFGITGGTKREHLVRSVLESIAFQVKEVVEAMNQDSEAPIQLLKVDGGACQNNFLMQFQADVLKIPVERPEMLDASAQGAAFAAGLAIDFWQDYEHLTATRKIDRTFYPGEGVLQAHTSFQKWCQAVDRSKNW